MAKHICCGVKGVMGLCKLPQCSILILGQMGEDDDEQNTGCDKGVLALENVERSAVFFSPLCDVKYHKKGQMWLER